MQVAVRSQSQVQAPVIFCLLLSANCLLHFFVHRVVTAARAELFHFQAVLVLLLVLGRRVIAILTVTALERYDFAHRFSSLWFSAVSFASFLPLAV
jgi:hypothetical protein